MYLVWFALGGLHFLVSRLHFLVSWYALVGFLVSWFLLGLLLRFGYIGDGQII